MQNLILEWNLDVLTLDLDSPVIFGAITIFGIVTWWLTPEEKWLPAGRLGRVRQLEEEFNKGELIPADTAIKT